MADIQGAKLTTSEIREITKEIESISKDVDSIMESFKSTMTKITGDAEGGIVEQINKTGQQLWQGVIDWSKCFLRLGIQIGDYLNAMINQDRDLAITLRERIES